MNSQFPSQQQSPLEEVGNNTHALIIEALESQTCRLLFVHPLYKSMLEVYGGCPPEIRRSTIGNATVHGYEDNNALYGLAVFDIFDENLNPTGAVFINPTVDGSNDIDYGHGGMFFNRGKLNQLPLIVTDDPSLAFKTGYPVYAPYADKKINSHVLKSLMAVHPNLCVIAPVDKRIDIQRRYTNLNAKIGFIPEPCSIDMSQTELDDIIKTAVDQANGKVWGELIPLEQVATTTTTPYPIHALPPLLQHASEAIAEYVQAPIAMTAQCVIGAISHIAQAHVNAPHPFNTEGEPCSLFLLTEGQSGSRKSTSKGLADKAIREHEHDLYKQYQDDYQQWKTQQAGLSKADREAYLAENPPPNDPSTLFSDGTLEAVAGLFIDGVLKNASISSDEAGQFFGGHTMKGDTRNQALGSYTKLFDDGSIQRTRSKSNLNGSGRAYDVRLTFNLQGQHEVLSDALKDNILREQGFLPRFILTVPENLAGTRLQDQAFKQKSANIDHRLIAYWERCKTLLDPCPMPLADGQKSQQERRVIHLNDEASQIRLNFYNECEREQGKGGKYEHIQPFASRASQLAQRLATVFAFFQDEQEITAKTMQGACDIIQHSLGEWLRYADIEPVKESDAEKLKKKIVNYCLKKSINRMPYSTAMNNFGKALKVRADGFASLLNELQEANYLRVEKLDNKQYLVINPKILVVTP